MGYSLELDWSLAARDSWLVGIFYAVSTFFGSFNTELSYFDKTKFSISTRFVYIQLNVKTVLFQTTRFSIYTQFKHTA